MMNVDGCFMDHGKTDTQNKKKQPDRDACIGLVTHFGKNKRGNLYDTNMAMKWAMRRFEVLRYHAWVLFIRAWQAARCWNSQAAFI